MPKQGVYDKPFTEEPTAPEWTPPAPPTIGEREWFVLFYERFGFMIAGVVTLLILAVLFINADLLLSKPDKPSAQAVADEQGRPSEEQNGPSARPSELAESVSLVPGEADTLVATVPLSITTKPVGASIYVDRKYVGRSPLNAFSLAEGRYLITVEKEDYAQLDTFVMLKEDSGSFQLTLRAVEELFVADNTEPSTDEEQPAVSHETAQTGPVQPPPATDEREVTPLDPEENPVAEQEEQPLPQVGELQINSEPSGASVSIDGAAVGVTPLLLSQVAAGSQAITLHLAGYEAFTTTVAVVAQQRQTVKGTLELLRGTLKVLAKPWGTIYIDGKLHKSETDLWYTAKLAPGSHVVEVQHATLGKWKQTLNLSPGEERSLTVDFN